MADIFDVSAYLQVPPRTLEQARADRAAAAAKRKAAEDRNARPLTWTEAPA